MPSERQTVSLAFIQLNDICVQQSGRLHNLLDQWKNHFEAPYTYYHASYVCRKLPPARKNLRSQPTFLPPSPKFGEISELIRSLLVTGEFVFRQYSIFHKNSRKVLLKNEEKDLHSFCRNPILWSATVIVFAFVPMPQSATTPEVKNGKIVVDLDQMFCLSLSCTLKRFSKKITGFDETYRIPFFSVSC